MHGYIVIINVFHHRVVSSTTAPRLCDNESRATGYVGLNSKSSGSVVHNAKRKIQERSLMVNHMGRQARREMLLVSALMTDETIPKSIQGKDQSSI